MPSHRTEIGIGRRVADEDVDPPEKARRLLGEMAQWSSFEEMLTAIGAAAGRFPGSRLIASAVSAQASALREEMTTVAPWAAKALGDGAADAAR